MIYLEKRNFELNQYRFYSLNLVQTLFGEWVLIRNWGRIGSDGSKKTECFTSIELARKEALQIIQKKRKRGYQSPLANINGKII